MVCGFDFGLGEHAGFGTWVLWVYVGSGFCLSGLLVWWVGVDWFSGYGCLGLDMIASVLGYCGAVVFVLILSVSLCAGFLDLLLGVGRFGVTLAILLGLCLC